MLEAARGTADAEQAVLEDAALRVGLEPADERGFSLREALRTRAYWLLAAGAAMPPMIGTAMLFDIQPLLGARGIAADDAATAVSAWSLTMAALAIPTGRLVDRRAPGPIIAVGLVAIAVSCALLHQASTATMAIAAMSVLTFHEGGAAHVC